MNASPPILQIHLLLNVLNRFAFTPGLGEREQSGIECLGDYLVAAHRLQTAQPGSPQARLQATVATLLALNQWLREEVAPTVTVRCASIDDERLSRVMVPLASRLQAALMLLDGQSIRQVDIELSGGDGSRPSAVYTVVAVTVEPQVPEGASIVAAGRDGTEWIGVDAPASAGTSMEMRFEIAG